YLSASARSCTMWTRGRPRRHATRYRALSRRRIAWTSAISCSPWVKWHASPGRGRPRFCDAHGTLYAVAARQRHRLPRCRCGSRGLLPGRRLLAYRLPESGDEVYQHVEAIVDGVLQDLLVELGVLVREQVPHADDLRPVGRRLSLEMFAAHLADGVYRHLQAVADGIADQGIVQPAARQVLAQHSQVFLCSGEVVSVPASPLRAHNGTASDAT